MTYQGTFFEEQPAISIFAGFQPVSWSCIRPHSTWDLSSLSTHPKNRYTLSNVCKHGCGMQKSLKQARNVWLLGKVQHALPSHCTHLPSQTQQQLAPEQCNLPSQPIPNAHEKETSSRRNWRLDSHSSAPCHNHVLWTLQNKNTADLTATHQNHVMWTLFESKVPGWWRPHWPDPTCSLQLWLGTWPSLPQTWPSWAEENWAPSVAMAPPSSIGGTKAVQKNCSCNETEGQFTSVLGPELPQPHVGRQAAH